MYTRRRREKKRIQECKKGKQKNQNNIIILFSKGTHQVFRLNFIHDNIPDMGGNNFSFPSPAPVNFKGLFTPKPIICPPLSDSGDALKRICGGTFQLFHKAQTTSPAITLLVFFLTIRNSRRPSCRQ
jgi:hypothetical protein